MSKLTDAVAEMMKEELTISLKEALEFNDVTRDLLVSYLKMKLDDLDFNANVRVSSYAGTDSIKFILVMNVDLNVMAERKLEGKVVCVLDRENTDMMKIAQVPDDFDVDNVIQGYDYFDVKLDNQLYSDLMYYLERKFRCVKLDDLDKDLRAFVSRKQTSISKQLGI